MVQQSRARRKGSESSGSKHQHHLSASSKTQPCSAVLVLAVRVDEPSSGQGREEEEGHTRSDTLYLVDSFSLLKRLGPFHDRVHRLISGPDFCSGAEVQACQSPESRSIFAADLTSLLT